MERKYKIEDEFVDHCGLHIRITKIRQDYYETLENNTLTGERYNDVRNEKYLDSINLVTKVKQ